MSEDVRRDESSEESEEKTDRRKFLKQAGMVGGGALAALAGLAAAAEAQDIRTRPRIQMQDIEIQRLPAIQAEKGASVEDFMAAFKRIQETGSQGPAPSWAEAMGNMSPAGRVGGTAILEMRQRFKESPNVGQNLVVLFLLLGKGMENLQGIDPRAMGNGCGDGCGTGCGTGCMSAVAGGFACGNGCGGNCMGADAAGLMCGGGCEATGLKQLSFDREGVALKGVELKGLNLQAAAAAMRNADRAYDEVFGR